VAWLALGDAPVVVFDTGAGVPSSRSVRGTQVDERFSVDVGAVRYTDRFGLAKAVAPGVVRDVLDPLRPISVGSTAIRDLTPGGDGPAPSRTSPR